MEILVLSDAVGRNGEWWTHSRRQYGGHLNMSYFIFNNVSHFSVY